MRIIFLDLDRTLLGDDYSPEPARPVIEVLKRAGFEVVLNSSKTRAEQEYYREVWKLKSPFIVENGSAVFIPKGYFPFMVGGIEKDGYTVIELGESHVKIVAVLDAIADEYGLRYYGNSTLKEVMDFTGLPEHLARLAMKREYSETIFRWEKAGFEGELEKAGLKAVRGSRFVNVIGKTDKGKAARTLLELYSRVGEVESYAVGDWKNDFPLFDVVDKAFIIGGLKYPGAKNISSIKELLEVVL